MSLLYLNTPTQVLMKSSKIIPVMIVGAIAYQRKYTFAQYASALMLIAGLVAFTLADASVTPNFNIIGVVVSMHAFSP